MWTYRYVCVRSSPCVFQSIQVCGIWYHVISMASNVAEVCSSNGWHVTLFVASFPGCTWCPKFWTPCPCCSFLPDACSMFPHAFHLRFFRSSPHWARAPRHHPVTSSFECSRLVPSGDSKVRLVQQGKYQLW